MKKPARKSNQRAAGQLQNDFNSQAAQVEQLCALYGEKLLAWGVGKDDLTEAFFINFTFNADKNPDLKALPKTIGDMSVRHNFFKPTI